MEAIQTLDRILDCSNINEGSLPTRGTNMFATLNLLSVLPFSCTHPVEMGK
jgi:hypothetical protein